MNMKKILILFGISLFISLNTMAVKQPHIVKPLADNASLKPLVVWTPIEDADSYSVKLKEINTATGLSATLETTSIAAPTTSYRPAATLTAGNFYMLVIRAIDGAEQSDKEKLYFQAKDKKLIIGDVDFEATLPSTDLVSRAVVFFPVGYAIATSGTFLANSEVKLPDGAIITALKMRLDVNAATSNTVLLFRQALDGSVYETFGSAASSTITAASTFDLITSADLDATKTTVDNTTYQYFLFLSLTDTNIFAYVEIDYID